MQINLRKAMFVLPNLFTVSSIFLGFYAMTLSAGDPAPAQLNQAALAIFFAIFFDAFDGRVARMTKTQSDFGVQLDSLADVISFGAAPALLIYKWALAPLGFVGFFLSFAFAACGALRLARFNVLAQRGDKGSSRFFVGLPIPLAAGAVVALVIAHYRTVGGIADDSTRVAIAAFVGLLAFLVMAGVAVAMATRPAFVLVVYMAAYMAMGPAEWLLSLGRRHPHAPLPPQVAAELAADEALEPDEEDEAEPPAKNEEDIYI